MPIPPQPLVFTVPVPNVNGTQASITGQVTLVIDLPNPPQPQSGGGPYFFYSVQIGYGCDMGLEMMPTAGPFPSRASVVRRHGGMAWRTVSFTAIRIQDQPELPALQSSNPNEVLLDWFFSPMVPGLLTEVTPIWAVSGAMVYGLIQPPAFTDGLPAGAYPFSSLSASGNVFVPALFNPNMTPGPNVANAPSQPITF